MGQNRFFQSQNQLFEQQVDFWLAQLELESNDRLAREFRAMFGSDLLFRVKASESWLSVNLAKQSASLMIYHVQSKMFTEHVVEPKQTKKELIELTNLHQSKLPQNIMQTRRKI